MMTTRLVMLCLVAAVAPLAAQVPASPGVRLGWTQADVDAPLLSYRLMVDTDAPLPITGVACNAVDVSAFDCVGDVGPFPTGSHTLAITAVRTVDGVDFDSELSEPLSIVWAEIPARPTTIVIIVGQ